MRERVNRAAEGFAQHWGIPRWKLNKGHPKQCTSDMREGSTKITRNSRVCWHLRVEGLGQFISFHLILAFKIYIMKVASFWGPAISWFSTHDRRRSFKWSALGANTGMILKLEALALSTSSTSPASTRFL